MKGITPVIAMILILFITIAIVGFGFIFFGRIAETAKEATASETEHILGQLGTRFRLDTIDLIGDSIYITNTGTSTISELSIYVDNTLQEVASETVEPNSLGIISLQKPLEEGEHTIKLVAMTYSVERQISVPSKWAVEFTVYGE